MVKRLLPFLLWLCAPLLLATPAMATFEVTHVAVDAVNQNGSPDVQAGSHPYSITTTFTLNPLPYNKETLRQLPAGQGSLKEVTLKLPPGFVGDPNAIPKCKYIEFIDGGDCPAETAIGVDTVYLHNNRENHGVESEILSVQSSVFNMEPSPGEPAEFAFMVRKTVPVFLDASVRTGEDYGITIHVPGVSQAASVYAAKVTIWGVPAETSHDALRGGCITEHEEWEGENGLHPLAEPGSGLAEGEAELETPQLYESRCEDAVNVPVQPLLTNPTSCGVPRSATVEVSSWQEPLVPVILPSAKSATLPALVGCQRLPFNPTIDVTPDGTQGSTPTGLNVDLHVPQEATENPVGLGEADVKNTKVTLPEGVQLSPSAADGLLACSPGQIGLHTAEPPTCPEASKVGTVEVDTPLLAEPLTGAAYLATQDENPFGSLIAMYVVAENKREGVLVKVAGQVSLNPVTGQLVTTFDETPQFPFSDFKLDFFGTDRAPLTTPGLCGTYTTETSLEPWSGTPAVAPSSKFQIASGPGGSPCSDPLPFQPSFESGTTNLQAGAYTPFELTMGRPDGDQTLSKVELQMPPGLVGSLSAVKLCEEPQAEQGTCGEESLIGHTTVSAGLGNDPYTVSGGKVYITGPYKGAPFGLSIVEPAVAGPFKLGTIVVRSQIRVDPLNSHLTVVSDPLPTIIDGIPIQIQHVNVSVDRPGFVFNPTDCDPMQLTAVLSSTEEAMANVGSPFQVTNCGSLAFKPGFAVSTSAKTSRTEGASLHVSLTLPAQAGQGTEANVAKVKVSLPKQLPSPLKTLQKACTEAVFAANPASCPEASKVGEARVSTPLLSGPLTGTAYFVSHGGAKYPELIMVLVGEDGVTVQVHGETFISKQGITSATFGTVPDVPFSDFELTLPEREYPALAADGNLCKGALLMPTEFVGQDGAKINQETKISVTGCPKVKKVSHKNKRRKDHRGKPKTGGKK